MITLFRRGYGASPLHLLALLSSFALAGYAVTRVLADNGPLIDIGIWFVGAAVGHDAVLYPLYAISDIAAHNRLLRRHRPTPSLAGVPWINHLRVPVALSGLLMLVWFPLILGGRDDAFAGATGLHTNVYLGRWLGITATLCLGSAVVYAVRLGRAARRIHTVDQHPPNHTRQL
ncbi:MAG TPA: hypothetical protein VIQ30_18205 [Pseudonocardia sp.]